MNAEERKAHLLKEMDRYLVGAADQRSVEEAKNLLDCVEVYARIYRLLTDPQTPHPFR